MVWSHMWRRLRGEIARYRSSIPRLRGLRLRDWLDMLRAQAALLQAQREMRSLRTGEMVREEPVTVPARNTDRMDDARRVALAVNRAATYGVFRPKCLVKSRALRKLLDERGIAGAQVRVGVQLTEGRFRAHAWVEYGGVVVGDDPAEVARFVPMPGINVAELE